ncbi:hypothetical protein VTN02DRAFT_4086 [Thermoascus thermophilus]
MRLRNVASPRVDPRSPLSLKIWTKMACRGILCLHVASPMAWNAFTFSGCPNMPRACISNIAKVPASIASRRRTLRRRCSETHPSITPEHDASSRPGLVRDCYCNPPVHHFFTSAHLCTVALSYLFALHLLISSLRMRRLMARAMPPIVHRNRCFSRRRYTLCAVHKPSTACFAHSGQVARAHEDIFLSDAVLPSTIYSFY